MRHPETEALLEARRKAEAEGLREEHIPLREYFNELVFWVRAGGYFALIVLAVLIYGLIK